MTEQLVRFVVPRVSVDFLADDLNSREKLTVLKYLQLDDAIAQIGSQRFGATTRDNIPLKPVRDWVTENWESEFVYDLSSRTVPITFRTALALALFTTRITEHLTKVGEVEVYASPDVKKTAEKNNLEIPLGLSRIDYASLSPEAKSCLVMPIVDNLNNAQLVAKAGHLFPNRINQEALFSLDPGLIFVTLGKDSDIVTFDRIRNLDVQAAVAKAVLKDIKAARSWQALTSKKVKQQPKEDKPKEERNYDPYDNSDVPEMRYEAGTTFLQVFPYKEGETPEDLIRAYKRIVKKGYYHGRVDQPHRGEYLEMHLDEKGYLLGFYGYDGWRREAERHKFDLLSERLFEDDWSDREFRSKNIVQLIEDLRDELDTHKLVVKEAQTKYGQTTFTVEQGFLESLTERSYPEATKAQIEEDLRLAREARKTALLEEKTPEEETDKLAVYSDQPVNRRTIVLDRAILIALKEHHSTNPEALMRIMFDPKSRYYPDNIGEWFASCASLLLRYQGVLVDTASLFAALDIAPTNDLGKITRAYRRIAFQTHPDRNANLTPEQQLEATDRFIKATAAYTDLQQQVGHINVDQFSPTFFLGRISQLFDRS